MENNPAFGIALALAMSVPFWAAILYFLGVL
jgi:hypothetical protein